MTAPDERRFAVFPRGHVRDNVVLQVYRNHLRNLTNPDTGAAYTEDEIAQATQPGSRFYIEADSIDVLGQIYQRRGAWFADQIRPNRANSDWLLNYHATLWLGEDPKLTATGGSGSVDAPASAGSVFPGSATVPDPTDTAAVATDPNGLRYQVISTVTTPAGGVATLQMQGIDTGADTNLLKDTVLTWSANQPVGAEPTAAVTQDPAFTGGFDEETDDELAKRVERRIRNRPAGGNSAHFAAWAERASVAIEAGFVYPTAFHAGSVLVAVLQKRGSTAGPTARTDVAVAAMTAVTNYLVPPSSPVVPQRVFVVVTECNPQSSDLVLRIAMAEGSAGGWFDATPWPAYSATYPEVKISAVTSQTDIDVLTDAALPGGASSLTGDNAPQLMVWDDANSRWERLDVLTVDASAAPTVNITLNTAPTVTMAIDDRISPYTDRLTVVAEAAEGYFDELGPGEVVDLDTDERGARAARHPSPASANPSRAGQAILSRLIDALGGSTSDAELTSISRNEPDLPGDLMDGPNIVTLGHLSAFPL